MISKTLNEVGYTLIGHSEDRSIIYVGCPISHIGKECEEYVTHFGFNYRYGPIEIHKYKNYSSSFCCIREYNICEDSMEYLKYDNDNKV